MDTQFFLRELDREAPLTAKMLERVPDDKFDWTPHDKSTALGKLAAHVSTLPRFATVIFESDSLAIESFRSPDSPMNREELLATFSKLVEDAKASIGRASEEEFNKTWEMTFNGKPVISMSKADVLQMLFFNHAAHHRAQLGVYLRLLDIAIPGTYGPSADEQ